MLSLDFDAGGRKGPDALFDDASLWPLRVIAMDLSRVGTDQGPDRDGIKSLVGMASGRAIFAAGGIRDARDLVAIAALRAHGALLATALHRSPVARAAIITGAFTRPAVRNPVFGATAESGPDHLIYRVAPDLGVLPFNQPRTGGERRPSWP